MRSGTADLSSVYFRSIQARLHSPQISRSRNRLSPLNDRLPAWTRILDDCLRSASQSEAAMLPETADCRVPAHPRPFEDVLVNFVGVARKMLQDELGADYHRLNAGAHSSCARYLLSWLADLNALSMQMEFAAYRIGSLNGVRRAFQVNGQKSNDAHYRQFIEHLRQGRLQLFLQEYAVLARLMATGIGQWVAMLKNLILRLKEDEAALSIMFNEGSPIGEVTEVFTTRSDRHNHGQMVLILDFANGLRLVYKPKDIGLERAYQNLAYGLNMVGAPHSFHTYRVLTGEGYGWAEFIPARPIPDLATAQQYYRRAGALLCLTYILGATDLHLENIIVSGEHPVLVDMETLMHPFVKTDTSRPLDARAEANQLLCQSVIRTGMLPRWRVDGNGVAYDVSALGAGIRQDLSMEWLRWKEVNTDAMHPEKEWMKMFGTGAGQQETQSFTPIQFSKEMIEGFRDTYSFLLAKRKQIGESLWWTELSGHNIRFVFRPTRVYTGIHKNLLQPRFLKRGKDRAQYLEILCKCRPEGGLPAWWPLIAVEKQAMERMDVPHFTTRADVTSIALETGAEVADYFQHSAFHNACSRLSVLSIEDMDLQTNFIAGTFSCRNDSKPQATGKKVAGSNRHDQTALTPAMALQQGKAIAKSLEEAAIRASDGSTTWIAPRQIPGAEKFQLDPVGYDLYSGTGGIALFFAAMFRLTGTSEYRQMVADIFRTPLLHLGAGSDEWLNLSGRSGGFTGWGSLAYSLHLCGVLINAEDLRSAAFMAASRITSQMIDEDQSFDLMHGSAGIIQSLARIYECQKHPELFSRMKQAGQHLLREGRRSATGLRSWPSHAGDFLSGYAHGASGISQALFRLHRITGEPAWSEAALEAIAWENGGFDSRERNWPDLRSPERRAGTTANRPWSMNAWCHGSGGIGLARLAALEVCASSEIECDVRYALSATRRSVGAGTDYLCCGNFGRLELLLQASRTFSERALKHETLELAGKLFRSANEKGGYRYHPAMGYTPGFFQGISGIGYQLLRLTHPEEIPSVLTLS